MSPRLPLPRATLLAAGALLAATTLPALAADVTITPPSGGGVVVNGPVTLTNVPGAGEQTDKVVCANGSGLLGPCPSTYGAQGPQGPAGPAGADGAPGAPGPMGPPGVDGVNGQNGAPGAPGAQGPAGPTVLSGAGKTAGSLTYYVPVHGRVTGLSLDVNDVAVRWPIACTASNLQVTTDGYPTNGGSSYSSTVRLMRGTGTGALTNTALTCTVSGTGDKSCSDTNTLHNVTIAANDRLAVSVGNTGLAFLSPNVYVTLTCQ